VTLPLWTYPLLFIVGVIAGLVDAIAGGGGIITLPVLLNLGLPVPLALGTNKLQSSFGSLSATVHYARLGLLDWRFARWGLLFTAGGALAGAITVRWINNDFLAQLIPWLLGAIVVYSIFRPTVGTADHPPKMTVR